MIWLTDAEYRSDYRLYVKFNDGTAGEVDLKSKIFDDPRPIFRALRDREFFSRLRVANDTISWENGLDLAPEYLYEQVTVTA